MFKSIFGPKPQPKPIPQSRTASSVATLSKSPLIATIKDASWVCDMCTFLNESAENICLMCTSQRREVPLSESRPANVYPESIAASVIVTSPQGNKKPPTVTADIGYRESRVGAVMSQGSSNEMSLLERKIEENHLASSASNVCNVITTVIFPNGEQFEQSISCPMGELKIRIASLTAEQLAPNPGSLGRNQSDRLSQLDQEPNLPRYHPEFGYDNFNDSFKETQANAGAFGGERVPYPTVTDSNSKSKYGHSLNNNHASVEKSIKMLDSEFRHIFLNEQQPPRHRSLEDKESISVIDWSEQIKHELREQQSLHDSGGSRVNHSSSSRMYALENYEKSVLIDPNRHVPSLQSSAVEAALTRANRLEDNGVPVEVAAVSSKIRNIHRLGGERVKEMDHFVETVSTPVIRVTISDSSGGFSAVSRNDIGAFLQASFKKSGFEKTRVFTVSPSMLNVPHHSQYSKQCFDIMVEGHYCQETSDGNCICPEYILRYSSIFHWLLEQILVNILGLECTVSNFQLYYMTTIRADELVCSICPTTGKLYCNVLVFQQSGCCELINNDASLPLGVHGEKLRETLALWLNRVVTAIYHTQGSSSLFQVSATTAEKFGNPSRGLFDNRIRGRYFDRVALLLKEYDLVSTSNPFEEAVMLMSTTPCLVDSSVNLSHRHEILIDVIKLLTRAKEDFILKEDAMGERACDQRLAMAQRLQQVHSK